VRLERSGNTLVVHVAERPSIDSIIISGTKDIDDKTLKQGLKDVGLAEGRVFNSSLLDKTEQELKRQYFSRGRYGVSVKTTVTPLERNRVAIRIDVPRARWPRSAASTWSATACSATTSCLILQAVDPSTFSVFTKDDQYSKQQLAGDLESLRSFYQNRATSISASTPPGGDHPRPPGHHVTVNLTKGAGSRSRR